MTQFKNMYYFILVMNFFLMIVFLCGIFTYKKTKTNIKFFNRPLFSLVLSVGVVSFILVWVPIFLKVWTYDDSHVKSSGLFISLLALELVSVIAFLALAYIFAYDFGIALNQCENQLQFFAQTINTANIIAVEEKKYSLKIVFQQGKKMKKKITIFTPKAKIFVKEILPEIIKANKINKEDSFLTAEENTTEQIINTEIKVDSVSTTQKEEKNS